VTLPDDIQETVRRVLAEDIGDGDITATLIPEMAQCDATVISRENAIICGVAWFDAVFQQMDTGIAVTWRVKDGQAVGANQILCSLHGPARPLLSGERAALNFLQTLSGTATAARRYADAVLGLPVKILDTRKTIPGLRAAQKYAVRCGGCHNHRHGLYDGILIKENHILSAGSITNAVGAARSHMRDLPVEVEVETLDEVREALQAGADILLLDNFNLEQMRAAVALNRGQAKLEASGGMSLDNLRAVAETGVDFISVGAITKNIQAIDLSMRFSEIRSF
jgi:nicotinate-nucleotide pyrophosphorylase (carboxylating)